MGKGSRVPAPCSEGTKGLGKGEQGGSYVTPIPEHDQDHQGARDGGRDPGPYD